MSWGIQLNVGVWRFVVKSCRAHDLYAVKKGECISRSLRAQPRLLPALVPALAPPAVILNTGYVHDPINAHDAGMLQRQDEIACIWAQQPCLHSWAVVIQGHGFKAQRTLDPFAQGGVVAMAAGAMSAKAKDIEKHCINIQLSFAWGLRLSMLQNVCIL